MFLPLWDLSSARHATCKISTGKQKIGARLMIQSVDLGPITKCPPGSQDFAGSVVIAGIDLITRNSAKDLDLLSGGQLERAKLSGELGFRYFTFDVTL